MKDAKKVLIIPQDPKNPNSIPVMRSTNQDNGLEFTWTVWLYVDDLVYKMVKRSIFSIRVPVTLRNRPHSQITDLVYIFILQEIH